MGKAESDLCRWCATEQEPENHMVFKCLYWKTHRVEQQEIPIGRGKHGKA